MNSTTPTKAPKEAKAETNKETELPEQSPVFQRAEPRDVGQLRFVVRFLRPYGWHIAGALAALVVAALAMLAFGKAIERLVNMGFSAENAAFIDQYFLALIGVVVVLAIATYFRFSLVSWLGERVVADMRSSVFNHVITLSPRFFEDNRSGEIASRLTADTTLIQSVVGSSASIALRNLLLFIGGLIAMMLTSVKLTLLVCAAVPAILIPILVFGRKVRRLSRASQDRIADVGAKATESFSATQTIQAFNHEAEDRKTFSGFIEHAFVTAFRRIRARAMLTVMVMILGFGAIDLVLWVGARDVIAGTLSEGALAAFVFYAVMVGGAVAAISESWGEILRAAGAAGRMMELMRVTPDIEAPEHPLRFPEPPKGGVAFDAVTFHYPTRPDRAALNGFSIDITPGETVALVGPSGAGKTTVFQLLLRFYDPQSGAVKVDGIDISQADPADVRARIGVVPQETTIFADTALENIRYGRPEATDDEVRAAIESAIADEFLDALPNGLETQLGERGIRLSGGQRQRIAIARAILRNPPILLLDEATSALDAENERLVQQALERLMQDRTTLVIAHRLATVLKADRILVMDEGRLVGEGTHEELLAQGGLYARLAELQFGEGTARLSVVSSG